MGSFDQLFKVLVVGDSCVGKTSLLNRYVHDVFGRDYKMTMGVDFALKVVQWSETEVIRLQLWDIAGKLCATKELIEGLRPQNYTHINKPGQERFTSMTRLYYKQASGCIIMFDITNADSFRSCQMWKNDLDNKATLSNGEHVPCILLANKGNLVQPKNSSRDYFHKGKLCATKEYIEGLLPENLAHINKLGTPRRVECDLSPWAVAKEQIDQFSKENNFIGWTEISVKENKNISESMRVLIERMMETRRTGHLSVPQGDYINIEEFKDPGAGCC